MHTPGPWFAHGPINRNRMDCGVTAVKPYDPSKGAVRRIAWIGNASGGIRSKTIDAEVLANARLIAAAPELLASCRSLVEALELIGRDHAVWWPHDGDLVVRARAAIAKAEGRT